MLISLFFFFSSRRRHTRYIGDWSSDVCSSDLMSVESRGRYTPEVAGEVMPGSEGPAGSRSHNLISARRASLMQEPVQIGRAACRERGEIAGGGGSLKKKGQERV